MMIETLPDKIKSGPHWRILIRPVRYEASRLPSLSDCQTAVEQARVRLRGWYFPHAPRKSEDVGAGQDYIAAGTDWSGQLEYWRFYQSGQFIGLYAVRETTEEGWAEKLRSEARAHYGRPCPEFSVSSVAA